MLTSAEKTGISGCLSEADFMTVKEQSLCSDPSSQSKRDAFWPAFSIPLNFYMSFSTCVKNYAKIKRINITN